MVQEHMAALFGEKREQVLREKLAGLSPEDRENSIVEELCAALGAKPAGARQERYVLPFRFKNDAGTRTSHHLIFVSKHPLGYSIMKEIMASEKMCIRDRALRTRDNAAAEQRMRDLEDTLAVIEKFIAK